MEVAVRKGQEGYSQVTLEILDLVNNLKKRTKSSMMVGEHNILRGIVIFEGIIKELNVDKMDDEIMEMIIGCINVTLFKHEERNQRVNNHVHYGISQCLLLLDNYNKREKRPAKILQKN